VSQYYSNDYFTRKLYAYKAITDPEPNSVFVDCLFSVEIHTRLTKSILMICLLESSKKFYMTPGANGPVQAFWW